MPDYLKYDPNQIDAFKEIGNIGASKAGTALSDMTDMKVEMNVPRCELVTYKEITGIIGEPEQIVVSVLVQFSGDMDGFIMLVQDIKDAANTIKKLVGTEVTASEQDVERLKEQLVPLEEIANIMISSYISAISAMTDLTMIPTVPSLCVDMLMAVMNLPALVYGEVSESVLMLETEFKNSDIKGHFFLMPTFDSYKKLMKLLCVE